MNFDWFSAQNFFGSILYALVGVVFLCASSSSTRYARHWARLSKAQQGAGHGGGRHVSGHLHHRRCGDSLRLSLSGFAAFPSVLRGGDNSIAAGRPLLAVFLLVCASLGGCYL